ncbi:MAG: isochorismate synthase [Acidimicrobiales bacterium]
MPGADRNPSRVTPRPLVRSLTRALQPGTPIDPVEVVGDQGFYFKTAELVLAGRGRAIELELPLGLSDPRALANASRRLRTLKSDDQLRVPGTGPLAFGSLAFERSSPMKLTVPSVLYGTTSSGDEWVTVVGEDPPSVSRDWLVEQLVPPPSPARPEPSIARLESLPADYIGCVRRAKGEISAGSMKKVVLARRLRARSTAAPRPAAVLRNLADAEPGSTAFLFKDLERAFVGASPELLMRRRGASVLSHPLAGTLALADPAGETGHALLASRKDVEEHELVVQDIVTRLSPMVTELTVAEPEAVVLATMAHLGTAIQGALGAGANRAPSALDLVAALHPTPAVGGVPTEPALRLIAALEPAPRDRWAGPVGWLDARGDGDWVIGIRSAQLERSLATIWAGAGIVAASDPEAELAETSVKLAPVLAAVFPRARSAMEACWTASP